MFSNSNYLSLALVTPCVMLGSFACKETEIIFLGQASRKLPFEIQNVARRKLRMMNNALRIEDLKAPPGNKLEKLKGNWSGFYSIRVNQQWRIVFRWEREAAYDIQILDYH